MEYPATTATVETLPNGLTLILDPDPTAPVVSAQMWVETGSMHEDRHLGAGISHFLEHMVFKGTRDYDADELADTVQAAGGHWNAYTSFDRTVYYIDGPSDSLPVFLKCLTGLVFFPVIPESEFEKEKDVIRREIDMGLDDPDNAATRLLFSTAFQRDPRRHPVIGHRHRFDAIALSRTSSATTASATPPDRCFVVISGDFDPERSPRNSSPRSPPNACKAAAANRSSPSIRRSSARAAPAKPSPSPPAGSPSPGNPPRSITRTRRPIDVLAAMLGRGRSSRLHRTLREERGLALEISAFSWTGPGREGLFAVTADAEPAKREALIEAIHAGTRQHCRPTRLETISPRRNARSPPASSAA